MPTPWKKSTLAFNTWRSTSVCDSTVHFLLTKTPRGRYVLAVEGPDRDYRTTVATRKEARDRADVLDNALCKGRW
jgi:hypothetical protein